MLQQAWRPRSTTERIVRACFRYSLSLIPLNLFETQKKNLCEEKN